MNIFMGLIGTPLSLVKNHRVKSLGLGLVASVVVVVAVRVKYSPTRIILNKTREKGTGWLNEVRGQAAI